MVFVDYMNWYQNNNNRFFFCVDNLDFTKTFFVFYSVTMSTQPFHKSKMNIPGQIMKKNTICNFYGLKVHGRCDALFLEKCSGQTIYSITGMTCK